MVRKRKSEKNGWPQFFLIIAAAVLVCALMVTLTVDRTVPQAVVWATTHGYATSDSNSQDACRRKQMITFLWRAVGSPAENTRNCPFQDVSSSDYYAQAACWAGNNGIVTTEDFNGDAVCTRAQAITCLYRTAQYLVNTGKLDSSVLADDCETVPGDVSESEYCYTAVKWACANGITHGTSDGGFAPGSACTRAQMLNFLYNASVLLMLN